MIRRLLLVLTALALSVVTALPASAASFARADRTPAIWADGTLFATRGLTELPAPNGHNDQSFDALYKFTNNPEQAAVSEAGPGNPDFNGGRWDAYTVTWTQAGFDAYPGGLPVLRSAGEVLAEEMAGHLTITHGDPDTGGTAHYFFCPLVPTPK